MRHRLSLPVPALAALLLLASCAGPREEVRPPEPAPVQGARTAPAQGTGGAPRPAPKGEGPLVAVAPLENRSNDLDASDIVRDAFVEGIASRGWNVMPTGESDNLLRRELGINYGGQLVVTTPAEVCRALGVEGVFYGDVLEWNKTTSGIYNDVVVAASFDLYGKDGGRRWSGNDRLQERKMPKGSGNNLLAEIILKAVENLVMTPMTPHGSKLGKRIAAKVPHGALSLPPAAGKEGREEGR